jgi:hypothetical protein
MATLIAILSSVMFVGGLIIVSRQFSQTVQLVIGIVMMVLALIFGLR